MGLKPRRTHTEEKYFTLNCEAVMCQGRSFSILVSGLTGAIAITRTTTRCDARIAKKYRAESLIIVLKIVGQVELRPHVE